MLHSPGCKCGDCTKVTQRSVNYRAGPPHRQCKDCTMFCLPKGNVGYGTCTLVAGRIGRLDMCDRFRKK